MIPASRAVPVIIRDQYHDNVWHWVHEASTHNSRCYLIIRCDSEEMFT